MKELLKKIGLWTGIILVTLVIQTFFSISLFKLNLTLLPVYYLGFKRGEIAGFSSGVFVGFLEDTLSGQLMGPSILGKGLVGVLASYLSDRFFIWVPMLGIVSVFLFTVLDELIVYLSLTIFSNQPTGLKEFAFAAILKGLINSPIGGFIKRG